MNRLIVALLLLPTAALAAEGKWVPDQVLEFSPGELKKMGLQLPPQKLWDAKKGEGLLSAAVLLSGCSGAFISETGLFITNHHCLFSLLQEHSTPERNLTEDGYLAKTQADELPGKTARVQVPRRFVDVTKEVLAAVPAGASDLQRFRAIERKSRELVRECEQRPSTRCQVGEFDGGVRYVLIDTFELSDVRLVYAPPRSVGEYGGEIDNFGWPRHTGDFAIARAYQTPEGKSSTYDPKNVAFKPKFFLPLSKTGVKPNDFVMVLGYPGRTYRSLIAPEMAERRELYFPRLVELLTSWIGILEEAGKESPQAKIATTDNVKSYLNRKKNAEGQIMGLDRRRTLAKQDAEDQAILAWARSRRDQQAAVGAYAEIAKIAKEKRDHWDRDFLFVTAQVYWPKALVLSTTVARASTERAKDDLDRKSEYMTRNLPRQKEKLEREQKRYAPAADKALLFDFVMRARKLPEGQRSAALERAFPSNEPAEATRRRIDQLYASTKVMDLPTRLQMFEETTEQLRARKDPLLDLALAFDAELYRIEDQHDAWAGALGRHRPVWRAAVAARAGRPVAFDANATLRVSLAHVRGYSPRDAISYAPQTTLAGVVEKHTGKDPFDAPARVLAAAAQRKYGPWLDPKLKDVPVAFLSDGDTSGGNSGSPTVNGRGELVGVNFDRVWENVVNDFGYDPAVARNVNVDVRYILWMLDQVENADGLLRELRIRR